MKNLLIVDLEATCYDRGQDPPGFFSEIIEIGAVVLATASHTLTTDYQTFVRPVLFPMLSAFCTTLTTIQQAEADGGLPLATALRQLQALYDPARAVFASWGFYDQRQIARVCARFDLPYPFAPAHISLKHSHAEFYRLRQPLGMDGALRLHQIALAGTHHRALDDARNIAKIAAQMLADGWTHPDLADSVPGA